jgi:flagellar protein FlaH
MDTEAAPTPTEESPAAAGGQPDAAPIPEQPATPAPEPASAAPEPGSEYDDPEEEAAPRLISVGAMDIDKKLGGGLPLDTVTLVEGDPEAGKSVVMQQLMYGALKEGFRCALFTSEGTTRETIQQLDTLGMPLMDYYLIGRLKIFEVNLRVDQEHAERLLHRLLKYIEVSEDCDFVLFDSVTPLLFQFDARYVLNFLAQCKEIANTGRTILVTLHSYAINESLRLRASSIVDAHLRLRIEELGQQVVRTLEVCKIRGAVKTIGNSVSFSVETGLGLKSIPISKTKA